MGVGASVGVPIELEPSTVVARVDVVVRRHPPFVLDVVHRECGAGTRDGATVATAAGRREGVRAVAQQRRKGHEVTLWERDVPAAELLQKTRQNVRFLGEDIFFPENLIVSSDLKASAGNAELVVLATPSHTIREVVTNLIPVIRQDSVLINVAKGIENGSFLTMSQVISDVIKGIKPERIAALYGPSHAEEVSRGLPTTVVASSLSIETARKVREAFVTPMFRVYSNTDLIGVEVGGSVKNVMAIASGISDGIGFGDNAKAALMTRGINEITRLGLALEIGRAHV